MKKNKELHLVQAASPLPSSKQSFSFLEIIRIITSQKIHIHTFGHCVNKKDNELFYREEKNNKYFHFHEKMRVDNLIKKMSEYDYGIILCFYDLSIINPMFPKSTMSNRMFDYIGAGIPIIISNQQEFMLKIIEENKIGFGINHSDLKNLKKIIQQKDYKKLQQNVKKAQEKFRLSKSIEKLEDFYEMVVNKFEKEKLTKQR